MGDIRSARGCGAVATRPLSLRPPIRCALCLRSALARARRAARDRARPRALRDLHRRNPQSGSRARGTASTREPVGFRPPPRPATRLIGRARVEEVTWTAPGAQGGEPGGAGRRGQDAARARRGRRPLSRLPGRRCVGRARDRWRPGARPERDRHAGSSSDVADDLQGRRVLLILDNLEQVLACAESLAELVARTPPFACLSRAESRSTSQPNVGTAPLSSRRMRSSSFANARRPLECLSPRMRWRCRTSAVGSKACRLRSSSPPLRRPSSRRPSCWRGLTRPTSSRGRGATCAIAIGRCSHDRMEPLASRPAERVAFARLGVFAGSWTLEAATRRRRADRVSWTRS